MLIFLFLVKCIMKNNSDNTWLLTLFVVIWFKRRGVYPTSLTSGFSQMFKTNFSAWWLLVFSFCPTNMNITFSDFRLLAWWSLGFSFCPTSMNITFLDFRLLNFICTQMVEENALLCLIQTSAWTFTLVLHALIHYFIEGARLII